MDITKEFLDMTYPDKYYKNVIQPAKMGTGPVPSKLQMLGKSQPIKAVSLPIQNFFSPGKYDAFRAAPTGAASKFLGSNLAYGLPFAYASGASALQKSLEKQGLTGKGGIADVSGLWGAMGAGADVQYDIDEVYDDDEKETITFNPNDPKFKQAGLGLKQLWNVYKAYKAGKNIKKYGPKVLGAITGAGGKRRAAANEAAAQRREGKGGTHMSRSVEQGGLGISQSQAQAVSDANRAAGMSGWNLARGGRASYFDGGLASLWLR